MSQALPKIIYFLIHLNPWACIVGFVGGLITMINYANVFGSGAVAIFLAICTMVGERVGKYFIKEFETRWKKYKAKKRKNQS